MVLKRIVEMAVLVVGWTGAAFAESESVAPAANTNVGGAGAVGSVPANGKGKRQEVRQKIQMVRIWELSRALGLDQKAATALFPTLSKFDEQRAAAHKGVRDAMQALRKASQGPKPDDAQIQAVMEKLTAAKGEVHRVEMEEIAELRRLLTPSQQAKYVLFQQRFSKRLEGMIRKVKEARAGRALPTED